MSKQRRGKAPMMVDLSIQERRIVGIEDMVLLTKISNEGIVENLKKRFQSDEIYTYIGPVLISCNPFKMLPLYDATHVKMHENANRVDLAPHIYAVAEASFRMMVTEEDKQCVIISGESGAGKTEAAKQIMSFISAVSGSGGNDRAVNQLKEIILDSNPVLEAFGNAMTLRNNNSSRFGKYFQLRFDLSNGGTPRGGLINNYLLEKSRVVSPGKGERSYHIFYQMLLGADGNMRKEFALGSPDQYGSLRQSGVFEINNEGGRSDDRKDFEETLQSMQTVGMDAATQKQFFQVVATVLHLSNIEFQPADVNGAEGSRIKDPRTLQTAAMVLQVDGNALEYALTKRTLTTMAPGGAVETYQVPSNPTQAKAARDALAKDLYNRLFNTLVATVNDALVQAGGSSRKSMREQMRGGAGDVINDETLSIGVLDIFGFEIFETNLFEQLCINFVNERLQQLFIALTIKSEQDDYASEGIAWTPIPYFDNAIVIELIEGKNPPGIFSILDDTAKTIHSKGGAEVDEKFLEKLNAFQSKHRHYKSSRMQFTILHYAGDVTYSVAGFIDSNKDTLGQDLLMLTKTSRAQLVQGLYPEEVDLDNRKAPPSAGAKLRQSTSELIFTLMDCTPHYVRCIKTNDRKKANIFDDERIKHQVTYLGLLENVKVRRAGFAFRVDFFRFVARFKVLGVGLMDQKVLSYGTDHDICAALVNAAKRRLPILNNPGEIQMGKSKVFLKQPESYFALQELRKEAVSHQAVKIQQVWRRFATRKDLVSLRQEMADLWEENGKEPTAADLLRPYRGTYLNNDEVKLQLAEILEFFQANEATQERLQFTDFVHRVNSDNKLEQVVLAITDQACYLCEWKAQPIDPRILAEAKKNRHAPPNPTYSLNLIRRSDLHFVEACQVSHLADDFLMVLFRPQEKMKNPKKDHWQNASSVKRCQETQEPFSFFGKSRHQCAYTGGVYVKEVMVKVPALPDYGWYGPVEVHNSVVGLINIEAQEDWVLVSEKKAEIAAVIRDLVTRARGGGGGGTPQPQKMMQAANMGATPIAKALYDYTPGQPDELELRVGMEIDLLDTSNADWWVGIYQGKKGVFPAAYAEKITRGGAQKPKRANPKRGYLINILFNDVFDVRGCGYGKGLSNNPSPMNFVKDPSIPEMRMQVKGKHLIVSVPPGVAGPKIQNIKRMQQARMEKAEQERQRLFEARQANAQLREAERTAEREKRLDEKRAKKAAEKERMGGNKAKMEDQIKGTGASFAARLGGGSFTNAAANNNTPATPPWEQPQQAKPAGAMPITLPVMPKVQQQPVTLPKANLPKVNNDFVPKSFIPPASALNNKQQNQPKPVASTSGGGGGWGSGNGKACNHYQLDMQGASFGVCKCGFPKADHNQTGGGGGGGVFQASSRTTEMRKEIKSLTRDKVVKPPAPPKKVEKQVWQEFKDDDSGDVYFWNSVTNETQWEKPVGYKKQ